MMLLELQSYLSVSHIPAVTHTVPPRAADTPMSLSPAYPTYRAHTHTYARIAHAAHIAQP